ncbi:hypothetical protein BGW38_000278 [Lunasporangiospora selenospora]|uniref:Nicastrin n=1 Tax=Lunasporangiospora selenospora TaxID=979761 RepID=A0A9P6FXB1_9FUNG|nr:hypothetical protein BGW38_000278 [Lunasporangiospora selenospora]
MNAASGVLYKADSQDDIQTLVSDDGRFKVKYTVLLPYWLLTNDNVRLLYSSKKAAAIIAVVNGTNPVHAQNARPTTVSSPDTTCPNCEFGLYAGSPDQYQWNPTGTGQLYQSYDLPIYALNTMDQRNTISYNAVLQAAIMNKVKEYRNYPLKSLQFNSFMWGAQNSEACLRKGWCTPVGGASVWSTPSTNISATDNKPIIVVSAAMDSRSLFHDITLGVESSVTGMVTVLAVAEALSRSSIPLATMPKHVLYTLFTAEAWGFSGSQRFVNDVFSKVECIKPSTSGSGCSYPFYSNLDFQKINSANIEAIFEAGQIGGIGSSSATPTLFAHVDKNQAGVSAPLVKQLIQVAGNGNSSGNPTQPSSQVPVQSANADGVERGLPPSSAMSFLKSRASLPAVVLTDYQKEMSSYTSQDLDDTWNPDTTVRIIQQAASVISRTVWLQAQGISDAAQMTVEQQQAMGSIEVNPQLVHDLLNCLTLNYSCPLVDAYLNVTASPTPPMRLPHYSGTLYSQSQPFPIFAWSFLANMTRFINSTTNTPPVKGCSSSSGTVQCSSGEYCVGDQCIATLTRYHDAFGTGIGLSEDNNYYIKDASKPVWTESTWDPIGLRLFEVTSPTAQGVELGVGIILTVVSAMVVWYSKKFLKKTLKQD